jgi:hypothetical protein
MTDSTKPERYEIHDLRAGTLIATAPSAEAVGVAIIQQAEDRWEIGDFSTPPAYSVLDTKAARWVTYA